MTDELSIECSNWYNSLIEECKDIVVEHEFASRWALVEGYHKLGERIVNDQNFQSYARDNQRILQSLAKSINLKERTLYYAVNFYKTYPELSLLPEGKNTSWSTVIKKYLTTPEQKPDYHLVDEIYKYLWGDIVIHRRDKSVKIQLRTQRTISGYEIIIPYSSESNPLNLELELNPKGTPQFYFIGIHNTEHDNIKENIFPWVLVDWLRVELECLRNPDFKLTINTIPKECIAFESKSTYSVELGNKIFEGKLIESGEIVLRNSLSVT